MGLVVALALAILVLDEPWNWVVVGLGATWELADKGIEPDGELESGYGFRYRHFRARDGRRFELLDRRL